jgi:hypothetical protein
MIPVAWMQLPLANALCSVQHALTPQRIYPRAGRMHHMISGMFGSTLIAGCLLIIFIRWKYALFLAIDANFWLKWKLVSSNNVDPSLNAGTCYFVEETVYKQYLSERGCEPQEVHSYFTIAHT